MTVLDQSTTLDGVYLPYAPPFIQSISPLLWPAVVNDTTFTLRGSGFGVLSTAVALTVAGLTPSCTGTIVAVATSVSLVSDSVVTFQLLAATPFLVHHWAVNLTVSGQSARDGSVTTANTAPPAVSSLTLVDAFNGSDYFVGVSGSNFGPAVAPALCSDAARVAVTINTVPCKVLTMDTADTALRCDTGLASGEQPGSRCQPGGMCVTQGVRQ